MRAVVLSIAGLDPGGGAGIVADVKTIEAHGCWAAAVATSLTVQTVARVSAFHGVPPGLLADQIDAVFEDHAVAAVKVGLLGGEDAVRAVARALLPRGVPVVLDPVCASTSGTRFLDGGAIARMREELLPGVAVVTPNLEEARILADATPATPPDEVAAALRARGVEHVLITCACADAAVCTDLLYSGDGRHPVPHRRVETDRLHGTGCLHSSSLAARLGRGASMLDAAAGAARWVSRALEHGVGFGAGGAPDAALRECTAPAGTLRGSRP